MIYFSIDIETNGLCPGINSMISLGAAAFDIETGEIADARKWNILPLPDLEVDADTMMFWDRFPEAYLRATVNAEHASHVMFAFREWVQHMSNNDPTPVAAAWKPGFDLAFLRYYEFRFLGKAIFGRGGSGLDIKTATAIALNQPFRETQIGTVPSWMKNGQENHTHDAMEDAIEQAHVLYHAQMTLGVSL